MIRRRLVVRGRVQGVFYRDWLVGEAHAIGVAGWVRNRADGSVEAVVGGTAVEVEAIAAKARQGSPAARVDDVAESEAPSGDLAMPFERRPSA